mmetsp:Transcript_50657/g.162128  ORF Transcript_50657/g.162128 Transcript_50657/m.162128 type:complete len:226 (+) Transcript_50657:915-1592(+)
MSRPGTLLASAGRFKATIQGRGGHGAMPHTTRDPIVAGAAIVSALQTIVSREISPLDSAVVTVAEFHGGHAHNVIPDSVMLGGTMRALTLEAAGKLSVRLKEVIEATAVAYGCTAEVDFEEHIMKPYPPTVNDKGAYEFGAGVALRLVGPDKFVGDVEPTMAGEDFAYLAQEAPGCFMLLGIKNTTLGSGEYANHHPKFQVDEEVLPLGAALHTALAVEWLATHR